MKSAPGSGMMGGSDLGQDSSFQPRTNGIEVNFASLNLSFLNLHLFILIRG